MSKTVRNVLLVVAILIFSFFAVQMVLNFVLGIFAKILTLLFPILIVAGIAYLLYVTVNKKTLGSGNKRILP